MKKIMFVLILLSSLILSGCSIWNSDLEVLNKPIDRTFLQISAPAPLDLEYVEYKVITPNNVNSKFEEVSNLGNDKVFIALTPKGYEALARNTIKIQNYIREQQEITIQYRIYYESQTE